jgi:hypothetical protein
MRLFGFTSSHIASDWDDEPGDVLVARLQGLARGPADHDERVARTRTQLRVAFADAQALRAARSRPSLAPRRLALAFAAATLLVIASVGGIAATAPGLPLYGFRLSVETALLPASPGDRLLAQLDRLDRRLDEAAGAHEAGDEGAVVAALQAYEEIAGQVREGSSPPLAVQSTARARLNGQVQRLEVLGLRSALPESKAALGSARAVLGWLLIGPPDTNPVGPPQSQQPGSSHDPAATQTMSSDPSVPGHVASPAPSRRPHGSPDPTAGSGGGGGPASSSAPGGADPGDQGGGAGGSTDRGGP